MLATETKIDFSRLYGVTHDLSTAEPIVQEPKLLKVSIGAPKGKAILVYTQPTDTTAVKWWIKVGAGRDTKDQSFATRKEVEKAYRDLYDKAPELSYPRKLSFFTFSRPTADGFMEPDFDAIEAHGPMPTEIDVVFMSEEPFEAAYAMWSATELRCKGNGVDAERLVRFMAEDKSATDDEKGLVKIAQSVGLRRTLVLGGCAEKGCRFSKPDTRGNKELPPPCKLSGDLKFQLANKLRIGGTAYFHTSGFKSVRQIFSALQIFRTLTGRGDYRRGWLSGLPFRMVVRPYMTKHNGQAAKQYGIGLEFRADTVAQLKQKMLEQAFEFRETMGVPRQLPSSSIDPSETGDLIDEEIDEIPEAAEASAIAAEFYPEADDSPTPQSANTQAATATSAKTESLRERVKAAAPTGAPSPGPAVNVPVSQPAPVTQTQPKKGELFF